MLRKQQELEQSAVRPDILGKILLPDAELYKHQAEVLQLMSPLIYPDQAHKNTAIMWPRQSGLTTTLAIMAIHHALFSPHKTAAFLLNKTQDVKAFEAHIEELYGHLQKSHDIKIPLSSQPGRIIIKTSAMSNIRALKGENAVAVYLDTPAGLTSTDALQRVTTIMEASAEAPPRIHMLTSGWNAAINHVIKTGNVRGTPFHGHTIDVRTILSTNEIDDCITNIGESRFISEYACMDPADPNALAKFNQM